MRADGPLQGGYASLEYQVAYHATIQSDFVVVIYSRSDTKNKSEIS